MSPAQRRRSTLFVGALALEGLPAALASGADIVCIDLEDAVPPQRKDEAREAVVTRLAEMHPPAGVQVALRINTLVSPEGLVDLQVALSQMPAVGALMLPKVESVEEIRAASRAVEAAGLATELYAIIESARGLECCTDIAAADTRLKALFFGGFDMSTALGWIQPAFLYKVGIIKKHCSSICCNEQVTISQNKIII